MSSIVCLKLTAAEVDLLDWLVNRTDQPSRSECLRNALRLAASRAGVQPSALLDVQDEREQHKPRRRLQLGRPGSRRRVLDGSSGGGK